MKKVLFILIAAAFSAVTFGQTINVSGDWAINASKSKPNEQFSVLPKTMKITQTDTSMTIEKKTEFQGQENTTVEKYSLNGKECSNPGFMESVKKSKAVISDDKKSIKITSKVPMNENEINTVEVFALDGAGMTYQSSSSSSFGDMSETGVYDKK
jgi:hypothetical protein